MNFPADASFLPFRPAAWLRVTGADAPEFLQGQFSNDLSRAADGAVYGLWLDHKGRVRADSFVLRRGAEFWLGSYGSAAAGIRSRLEDFIVADDVAVEDATSDWAGVALIGEGTGAWLAADPRPGMIFRGRRASGENWEWVFPATLAPEVRAGLPDGFEEGQSAAERRRIGAGIPLVPSDLGPGDLPHEGGLEAEAISYTKGCYLGQEVMARLRIKGRIRRRLGRVAGPGPIPAPGTALWQEGIQVGDMRTAAPDGRDGFCGLAMFSLMRLRPEALLAAAADAAPEIRLAGRIIG